MILPVILFGFNAVAASFLFGGNAVNQPANNNNMNVNMNNGYPPQPNQYYFGNPAPYGNGPVNNFPNFNSPFGGVPNPNLNPNANSFNQVGNQLGGFVNDNNQLPNNMPTATLAVAVTSITDNVPNIFDDSMDTASNVQSQVSKKKKSVKKKAKKSKVLHEIEELPIEIYDAITGKKSKKAKKKKKQHQKSKEAQNAETQSQEQVKDSENTAEPSPSTDTPSKDEAQQLFDEFEASLNPAQKVDYQSALYYPKSEPDNARNSKAVAQCQRTKTVQNNGLDQIMASVFPEAPRNGRRRVYFKDKSIPLLQRRIVSPNGPPLKKVRFSYIDEDSKQQCHCECAV